MTAIEFARLSDDSASIAQLSPDERTAFGLRLMQEDQEARDRKREEYFKDKPMYIETAGGHQEVQAPSPVPLQQGQEDTDAAIKVVFNRQTGVFEMRPSPKLQAMLQIFYS